MLYNPPHRFPGLELLAWARMRWDGAALTLVDGFNVSGVNRVGAGQYNVTFATALPHVGYVCEASNVGQCAVNFLSLATKLVGSCTLSYADPGVNIDVAASYVAFYG